MMETALYRTGRATLALCILTAVAAVAWAEDQPDSPLFAIAGTQDSPGLTEADLTPAFVAQLEAWAIATLREKMSTAFAVTGQDARQAEDLYIQAHSMLLVVEDKRLAVIQTAIGDQVREVSVLGFRNGEFYRVGCVRESGHDISVFFGKCGRVVSKTFGIAPPASTAASNPFLSAW